VHQVHHVYIFVVDIESLIYKSSHFILRVI
jgi:hypothetical protein